MTSFIRPKNLNDLARDLGLGTYAPRGNGTDLDSPKTFSLRKAGNDYIFSNLAGFSGDVTLLADRLDGGNSKTYDQWRDYVIKNKDNIIIPSSVLLYQLARCLYNLRDNSQHQNIVQECAQMLREDWDRKIPHTGTKITYGSGIEAVINHLQPDKSSSSISLDIPELTRFDNDWSYFVLAPEQAELQPSTNYEMPKQVSPVLHALFGEGYEQAGEIFQYFASRKNGAFREVRFWVPTESNRNTERAVVLGVSVWFGISAIDGIGNHGSARGVVVSVGR